MTQKPDFFRNYGIIPGGVSCPDTIVRASFSRGQVIGQYLGSVLMAGLGIGMAVVFAIGTSAPWNVFAPLLPLVGFGYVVYRANRNDYLWVELDGHTLRARHMYTGRVVHRSIEEIDDLLTLVFQVRTAAVLLNEAWLGRVRGIMIRFRDQRTPLQICRADPAMKNAKEMIEAVVYRMSEKGEVDVEVVDFEGRPLVRRIHWKHASA